MKKVIEELAVKFNCTTAYAGGPRIMYVKGERNMEFVRHVRELYPTLAFILKGTDELPKVVVYSSAEVNADLAANIVNNLPITVNSSHLSVAEAGSIERTEDTVRIVDENGTSETFVKEVPAIAKPSPELRAKVDEYLIQYQNNKNEKGFYTAAATFLGTNSEYIRDRYRKLKSKGLVETLQTV